MSPGPLTSHTRGGLHFQHGARTGFSPVRYQPFISSRTFSAPRGRFTVAPYNGGSRVTLGEDERVTISTDDTGAVVIDVAPADAGNGDGTNGNSSVRARAGRSRMREKMTLFTNDDGEVVLRPEGDNTLQVIGDPDGGAVAVVELEPAPSMTPNGGNGANGR